MKPEDITIKHENNKDTEIEANEPVADLDSDTHPGDAQASEDVEVQKDEQDNLLGTETEALQAEIIDLNDKLLRALAETENIRRRADRDKADASKYAITNFAREMLTIRDTLQRALGSVDVDSRKEHAVIEQLFVGLEMNEREIKIIFERFGIKTIEAMSEKFDHNFHEAMFEIEDSSQPAGTVVQVVETGYVLKDRLLRPAKVGVSKGGPVTVKDDSEKETISDSDKLEDDAEQKAAYENNVGKAGVQLDEEL